MLPLTKFSEILRNLQQQMYSDMDEVIAASDLVGAKPTFLTVDEHGYYHLQVSGVIDEVIAGTELNLAKLKRIKEQRDSFDSKQI